MICIYIKEEEEFFICGNGCDGFALLLRFVYNQVHCLGRHIVTKHF